MPPWSDRENWGTMLRPKETYPMVAQAGPPLAVLTIVLAVWWAVSAALWPARGRVVKAQRMRATPS